MNTSIPPEPTTESPLKRGESRGYEIAPNIAALNVMADDDESYQLPYAQFLYSRLAANPALEETPNAPPQRLLICFAMAEVVVVGSGLDALTRNLQSQELKCVRRVDQRLAPTLSTHIASVTITLNRSAV